MTNLILKPLMVSLIYCAPNIIFLTEHHLLNNEIDTAWLPSYKLAANYTRNSLKCGGVCYQRQYEILKGRHTTLL